MASLAERALGVQDDSELSLAGFEDKLLHNDAGTIELAPLCDQVPT